MPAALDAPATSRRFGGAHAFRVSAPYGDEADAVFLVNAATATDGHSEHALRAVRLPLGSVHPDDGFLDEDFVDTGDHVRNV
jgi:hypothetical protein